MIRKAFLDGIQYLGHAGITRSCVEAVEMLLQCRRDITVARLISIDRKHAFLLWTSTNDVFAIQSGFASGYGGEGPSGLSYVLSLLEHHEIEIEEVDVNAALMDKLERCTLTYKETERLRKGRHISPRRFYDYIFDRYDDRTQKGKIWQNVDAVLPFGIIHPLITDLVVSFWADPDKALLTAFRRLEDRVRIRSGLDEHGSKLFARAFANKVGKLTWLGIDEGEIAGRQALFTGVYQAFRNPRAHREPDLFSENHTREFLLVNELFHLEGSAIEIDASNPAD